ncbi:MAG: hypothetical protein COV72_04775 [Candidatus Omnitrophica bacterium CG11_big_fil_rev_8_21_14_0_20_42_13]|uniref:DUF4912 domain-containing protein n=1 Tax=Candidatus Ghiorseimicrobium undicola TaxID=1974746 RepID=A0A2H0LXM1_9BACT|nr:MAG: hypothetical protein COV72_04775 [Candidatus Omnitrophica bacterium CG11_big_fil_rev_8_21_14_0_20_42_13]
MKKKQKQTKKIAKRAVGRKALAKKVSFRAVKPKAKKISQKKTLPVKTSRFFSRRRAAFTQPQAVYVEAAKPPEQGLLLKEPQPVPAYSLPKRYKDNRLMLLARDPWWLHAYWDISEERINEVISFIPLEERQNLRWVLRVYDVTGVRDFRGDNANNFFDLGINFDAANWYINVDNPEREWCVEIGLMTVYGKFFAVARSNIIKAPYFGISSVIDEEWALPDEEFFRLFGMMDLSGKSSLEVKKKIEEIFKKQISSPVSSWGISSLFSEREKLKEDFFLEVWTELILYGRTRPKSEVSVEGKKVSLRDDGTFSLRYALPEGDFKYEVQAVSPNKKHKLTRTPAVKRFTKD